MKEQLNLKTMKRQDPFIESVHATFEHVALYFYEKDSWVNADIEGPMFIVQRTQQPWYRIVVINRKNTTNYNEDVTEQLELDVDNNFVLYKNAKNQIVGLWFHDTLKMFDFVQEMKKLIQLLQAPPAPATAPVNNQQQQQQQHYPIATEEEILNQTADNNTSHQLTSLLKTALNIQSSPQQVPSNDDLNNFFKTHNINFQMGSTTTIPEQQNGSNHSEEQPIEEESAPQQENDSTEQQQATAVLLPPTMFANAIEQSASKSKLAAIRNKKQFQAYLSHLVNKDEAFLNSVFEEFLQRKNKWSVW